LLQAFRTVFPACADEMLEGGSPTTLESWDSTNHFVLLQVVEEMFEVHISEREAGELLSFTEFEAYLNSRLNQ